VIKLLLTLILKFVEGGHKRQRDSNDTFTIVIYQVLNKLGIEFTRIDIFTKDKADGKENRNPDANEGQRKTEEK
jgi:hypothetical protein